MIRDRVRRAAYRALLVAGVVYVVNLAVFSWLWRHRHAVVRLLAEAAADLADATNPAREPATGEGVAGSRTHQPSAASYADRWHNGARVT